MLRKFYNPLIRNIFLIIIFCLMNSESFAQSLQNYQGEQVVSLASFTENFDNVTPPALPAGWTGLVKVLLSNTAAEVKTLVMGPAPSQPNAAFIMNGIDGSNGQLDASAFVALVTPLVEVGTGGAVLSFQAFGGNPIKVGTMSNPLDTSTFSLLQEFQLDYNFAEYTVTLNTPGETYIVFKHGNTTTTTPVFLDDVSFEPVIPALTSFTENFDNVTVPALPPDWTGLVKVLLSNTAAEVKTLVMGPAPSQPNAAFIMNGLDGSNGQLDPTAFVALVTPLVEVGSNGAVLKFQAFGGNPVKVGTMSDPADTNTFVLLQEFPLTYNFAEFTVTLTVPGQTYIAFKNGNNSSVTPVFIDDVNFEQTVPALTSFTENFDNVTPPALPADWSGLIKVLLSNTFAEVKTTLMGPAPSQPNAAFIFNGLDGSNGQLDANAFVALVTPLAEVGSNGAILRFKAAGSNPIKVGTMTNPADTSTFTLIQECALISDFAEFTVTLTSPGETYIVFKHGNTTTTNPMFVDDISFEQMPPALTSFTEYFDNVTVPALPADWTGLVKVLLSNTAAEVKTLVMGPAPSQPNAAFIMNGIDGSNGQLDPTAFVALVSPLVQVGQDGAVLRFQAFGGNSIKIGTMSDPADTNTFVLIQEFPLTYNFAEFTVQLTTPGLTYLAFKNGNNSSVTPVFVDNIIFEQGSVQTTFQLTVTVSDSWNMVSIPGLHPDNQNVSTWWINKDPQASVYKFNNGYEAVTAAQPGSGYWMKHLGDQVYNTGDEWPSGGILFVNHDPIPANAGWNLIGGYENTIPVSGITTTPPGLQTGFVYGYSSSGGYVTADSLVPGYAYWINLTSSGSINLPSSISKSEAVSEGMPENAGRIIFTDNSGRTRTLFMLSGGSEADYSLPPVPPAGLFDVRFNTGRSAENIGSDSKVIDMQGVNYPVKVRVEGMRLVLQDITGKEINTALNSGEEIVIGNSAVNKLLILSGEINPVEFSLEQNYPNPFNPSTVIRFSIPENSGNVKLIIYNALGERTAELINAKLESGSYEYKWNGSNSASGIYFYELRTDNFISIKKMMLIK